LSDVDTLDLGHAGDEGDFVDLNQSLPLDDEGRPSARRLGAALATTMSFATFAQASHRAGRSQGQTASPQTAFMSAYTLQFVREMIVGIIVGLICNGIWKIPLPQVVDVNLALSLSLLVLTLLGLVVVFFLELFNAMWRGALETLVYISTAIFLPFGAIVGYIIYGWLSGAEPIADSRVYSIYIGYFAAAYGFLAESFGDVLGAIEQTKDAAGEMQSTVNMQLIKEWVPILAALAAIINFFRDVFRSQVSVQHS
jgi:hypothetical protein